MRIDQLLRLQLEFSNGHSDANTITIKYILYAPSMSVLLTVCMNSSFPSDNVDVNMPNLETHIDETAEKEEKKNCQFAPKYSLFFFLSLIEFYNFLSLIKGSSKREKNPLLVVKRSMIRKNGTFFGIYPNLIILRIYDCRWPM